MTAAPLPPQNLDAEESVLGAMLIPGPSAAAVDAVAPILTADDFYRPSHGLIFEAAVAVRRSGAEVDAITVLAELERCGKLDDAGGRTRLQELANLMPATGNAAHYARIVRQQSRRRAELAAGMALAKAAENGGLPAHPEVAEVLGELLQAAPDGPALDVLWHEQVLALELPTEPFLVRDLIYPASVGTIAGEPETFKSLLAIEVACKVEAGGSVLGRFDVERSGPVGYVWQDDSTASEVDRIKRYAAARGIEGARRIAWLLNLGLRLPDDLDRLRALVVEHGLVLLVLDSLYNFLEGIDLRTEEVLPVVNGLKSIADDTDAAILVVDHAPKPTDATRGRRPNLSPYGSMFKAAAFRWGIYTEATLDGIRLSASSNNAPPPLTREVVAFDREAYELRLIETQHVAADEYDERVFEWLQEHPGETTTAVEKGVTGRAENIRAALGRLEDAGRAHALTSRDLGRTGTGRYWFAGSQAGLRAVPLPGTDTDVHASAQSKTTEPVHPSHPRRGDGLGTDGPPEAA